MTTYPRAMEDNPSLLNFFAWKLGKAMDRSASKKENRAHTLLQSTIRVMLHIVGFSSLTFAGFYWHVIAGLIVGGISCFALSWLLTTTDTPQPPQGKGLDHG